MNTLALRASLGLLVFVFWLTAAVTNGRLGSHYAHVAWFFACHALGYFLLTRLASPARLPMLSQLGALAGGALTATLTMLPASMQAGQMALLGLVTSPLLIQALCKVALSPAPMRSAMYGVVLGKLACIMLLMLPLPAPLLLALLGTLLAVLPACSSHATHPASPDDAASMFPYLPYTLMLHLVAGLMYSFLRPQFNAMQLWPHLDKLFYGLGIVLGFAWVQRQPLRCSMLVCVLVLLAFVQGYILPAPLGVLLAMLTMMLAVGINDIFLLGLILGTRHLLKSTAYLQGTVVSSIFLGIWLGKWIGPAPQAVSFAAVVLLNLSLLALITKQQLDNPPRAAPVPEATLAAEPGEPTLPTLADTITAQLSDKETSVLRHSLALSTYREVAEALGISESTVKTHIQRIYRKLGVFNRDGLLQKLQAQPMDHQPPASPSPPPPDPAPPAPQQRPHALSSDKG